MSLLPGVIDIEISKMRRNWQCEKCEKEHGELYVHRP